MGSSDNSGFGRGLATGRVLAILFYCAAFGRTVLVVFLVREANKGQKQKSCKPPCRRSIRVMYERKNNKKREPLQSYYTVAEQPSYCNVFSSSSCSSSGKKKPCRHRRFGGLFTFFARNARVESGIQPTTMLVKRLFVIEAVSCFAPRS